MFRELGGLFGNFIVTFYILAASTFIFKFINKKFKEPLKKYETVSKVFHLFLRYIVKYHKIFGYVTAAAILAHFLIEFNQFGINVTGLVAAAIMLLQVFLGAYGYYTKKRGGAWLLTHRIIAILLLVTILVHVV